MKKKKYKPLLIKQLKKSPIIETACQKVGVSRSSYYRWKNNDEEFADEAEKAIKEGVDRMNDLAESALLRKIEGGDMTGIIFYLKKNHPRYMKPEDNKNNLPPANINVSIDPNATTGTKDEKTEPVKDDKDE